MNAPRTRRACLMGAAVFVAVSAYTGAAELLTDRLDTKATIKNELPFHSPAFSAIGLVAFVGVPASAAAWYAWKDRARVGVTAIVAGVMLVGWSVVEILVVRHVNWFQLLFICVGAILVAAGEDAYAREAQGRDATTTDRAHPQVSLRTKAPQK